MTVKIFRKCILYCHPLLLSVTSYPSGTKFQLKNAKYFAPKLVYSDDYATYWI